MALIKCKMCGGNLDFPAGATVAECEYCGTVQTIPSVHDENLQALFNRANLLRRKSEFDKAEQIYERIIQADGTLAEAYWGLILCKYGIEYIEDPATFKRVPTCHRTSLDSVIADEDYKAALQYADGAQKHLYETEAKEIDRLQKECIALSKKEEPYDVFICYKETDENGKRTQDSVIANDIYYQLTQAGYKVFYAAVTLEDKLGSAYEPCIFAALNSAKVMLAIGTKPEYFNAVWVKNEWGRFLKMMKKDRSKLLIPCYKDFDPYELPEEFAHLQAQDMGRIGFVNDLLRGIKKVIVQETSQVAVVRETVTASASISIAPLIKRVFMFLEDGKWVEANEYCEKVLDMEPECPEAYLGKLMAELKVKQRDNLVQCKEPFEYSENYKKVLRFGNTELSEELKTCNIRIRQRNEENRRAGIYKAGEELAVQQTPEKQEDAARTFARIPGYRDADERAAQCHQRSVILFYERADKAANQARNSSEFRTAGQMFSQIADYPLAAERAATCFEKAKELSEIERKDAIYNDACKQMNTLDIGGLQNAIVTFRQIPQWRDAEEKIELCNQKIEQVKAEKERLMREQYEKARARKRRTIIILSSIAAVIIAIITVSKVATYMSNKKLHEAFENNAFTVAFVEQNYDSLQNEKEALKVIADQLNKCRKRDDLEQALSIMTVMAETDCAFTEGYYDHTGNNFTEYTHSIVGTNAYTEWLYHAAKEQGQEVKKDGPEKWLQYCDHTYEVHGYKLTIQLSIDGTAYGAYLYTPSGQWYEIDGANQGASAVIVK